MSTTDPSPEQPRDPSPDLGWLPMPSPASFSYEERDRVGVITLTRPDRYNALTFQVYAELTALFSVIGGRTRDPSGAGARALVLDNGLQRACCRLGASGWTFVEALPAFADLVDPPRGS